MIGRTNAGSGGLGKSTLVVQTETGSTVTATRGTEVRRGPERFGVWAFPGLAPGEWTVKAEKDGRTALKTVTMDGTSSLTLVLRFNAIPTFAYTGSYEIVDDNDNPITTSDGNWKIRFLTSGTLTFTELNGAEGGIDVFRVGGGGGGGNWEYADDYTAGSGGGGYTSTDRGVAVQAGVAYEIVIGAGGTTGTRTGNDGGNTIAFGKTCGGGKGGVIDKGSCPGGNGGSGGGASGYSGSPGADGGSDGGDGSPSDDNVGGKGQISMPGPYGETGNTREFGESNHKNIYSPGGGGSRGQRGEFDGSRGAGLFDDNSGAGGDGKAGDHTGKSGIVIIRNTRGAA